MDRKSLATILLVGICCVAAAPPASAGPPDTTPPFYTILHPPSNIMNLYELYVTDADQIEF